MNTYFLEILMKEWQREFADEFRRIDRARAAGNPGPGFIMVFKRIFSPISLPIGYLFRAL